MKKHILTSLILVVLAIGCDLSIGLFSTPTTTSTTTTTLTTTTSTTIQHYTHWRTKTYSYVWRGASDTIIQQYLDTYHYPDATTKAYDSRDRVYATPSGKHENLRYTRDERKRIVLREIYNVATTPETFSRSAFYTYDTTDSNYSRMDNYNSSGMTTSYYLYTYDAQRRMTSEAYYGSSSEIQYKYEWTYDDSGNLTLEKDIDYSETPPSTSILYVTTLRDSGGRVVSEKYYGDEAKTNLL